MKFIILISTLLFSVISQAQNQIPWWSKGDLVRVECKADASIFPELLGITIEGNNVTIKFAGETKTAKVARYQSSKNINWENKEFQLSVALRPSSWGDYHNGTLIVNAVGIQTYPLYCLPQ